MSIYHLTHPFLRDYFFSFIHHVLWKNCMEILSKSILVNLLFLQTIRVTIIDRKNVAKRWWFRNYTTSRAILIACLENGIHVIHMWYKGSIFPFICANILMSYILKKIQISFKFMCLVGIVLVTLYITLYTRVGLTSTKSLTQECI